MIKDVQALVGPITEEQLKFVDYYVCHGFGVFIPSVGFCGYAISPRHTHPSYSGVVVTSKAEGIFTTKLIADEHTYVAGFMPPNVPHEEEIVDTFNRYVAIMISKEMFEEVCLKTENNTLTGNDWCQFLVSKQIMPWINNFIKACEDPSPGSKELALHWATIITYEFVNCACGKVLNNKEITNQSSHMDVALQYIHQNFHSEIGVFELAKAVNMSESNFSRMFRLATGQTPAKYLHMVRLDKAKHLIRTGDFSITEVAMGCGFSQASYFSNAFKKAFGITPSQFKNNSL